MEQIAVHEPQILVVAEGETIAATNEAKGRLFERFTGQVLSKLGYAEPKTEHLNISESGMELDLVVSHKLSERRALAECKAYSAPVRGKELQAFLGKLYTYRLDAGGKVDGFLFAIPRLTKDAAETARRVSEGDQGFKYLDATRITGLLRDFGEIEDPPVELVDAALLADRTVVVSAHGLYSACKVLDSETRTATAVVVWGKARVPTPVLRLVEASSFAAGLSVRDVRGADSSLEELVHAAVRDVADGTILAEVLGSTSDFEYQLPASPKYFVGRTGPLSQLEQVLGRAGVMVINAQSGWGKSSMALRLKQSAERAGGFGIVFDTRTASRPGYVASALRLAVTRAAQARVLQVPRGASWASLGSALETLKNSVWEEASRPLLVFFDQFENVFRDAALTREFRDLALGVHELEGPLVVGYAWKTDLVGWTEDHPYQLRDEIRGSAHVVQLVPLGPSEVDTLLRRLERALGVSLAHDLKQRLREYSQGLPWLFKKLAVHVLSEVSSGTSQAELVAEALNVQSLFEADLAELQPAEQEGLRHIARFAPVPVSDVMDRVPTPIVQTLLNRRLIVQVGERLDTYWDIFRDFLVTGRVPIEDSYILRQAPASVGVMLQRVVASGGDVSVPELATALNTSEGRIFNLSRDLRVMGALDHEPNRVRLADGIRNAVDPEEELKARVSESLRRHRAYSTVLRLAEQHGGSVSMHAFARALPMAFPAVEAGEKTWTMYARSFFQWLDYAGLGGLRRHSLVMGEDEVGSDLRLLTAIVGRRVSGVFPQRAPAPALELLKEIAAAGPSGAAVSPKRRRYRRSVPDLLSLKAVHSTPDGRLALAATDLLGPDGRFDAKALRLRIEPLPGCGRALAALDDDPRLSAAWIGQILKEAHDADWTEGTATMAGKFMRAWAREAGVTIISPRAGSAADLDAQPSLFAP